MLTSLDPSGKSALSFNSSVAELVFTLCEPLFKNFGLTFFGYARFLNNGTYLDVCTNVSWQKHYIEKFASDPFINSFLKDIHQNRTNYLLWNNDPKDKRSDTFAHFITDSCDFDIWHGFTIYKHHSDFIETWHFATTKTNNMIVNFYVNHLEILEHFILYFRDKASEVIDPLDMSKLIVLKDRTSFMQSHPPEKNREHIGAFIKQTPVKRYYFNTKQGLVCLSPRETECVLHLFSRKTIKEIGRIMSLSPRTVECYVENVKRKLGCWSSSQLVGILSESMGNRLEFSGKGYLEGEKI